MALTANKFIIPNGSPSAGEQAMQSSTLGENDVTSNNTHRTNEDAVTGIVKCDGASNYSAAVADTDFQSVPAEGAFADGDKSRLDGIETGADVTDAVNVASSIAGVAGKATPVDADTLPLIDSADSSALKQLTWANVKATAKAYFDTLYAAITHASTHASGGSDAIKLDDLATPDDNTDLDATTGVHGLLPKLGGGTTNFLRADGTWADPGSAGVTGPGSSTDNALARFDGTGGDTLQNSSVIVDDSDNVSGIQNLTTTGGRIRKVTTVNAATYDLLVTDDIVHVTYTTTAAVTSLTLPTAQTVSGRTIDIKDAGGSAGTYNITIDTEGAETIDGAATLVISSDYGAAKLYSNGTNWFVL